MKDNLNSDQSKRKDICFYKPRFSLTTATLGLCRNAPFKFLQPGMSIQRNSLEGRKTVIVRMGEILTVCCLNSTEQRSFSLHSLRSKPEKQWGDIWGLLHLSLQRYSQTPTCMVQAPRPLYSWQINRSRGRPVSPCSWTCSHSHTQTHNTFKQTQRHLLPKNSKSEIKYSLPDTHTVSDV